MANHMFFASCVCVCVCLRRYGEVHPMFFIGSLEAASQEAFYGKAREVRGLLCSVARVCGRIVSGVLCYHHYVKKKKKTLIKSSS